jgi:hypothetical protein
MERETFARRFVVAMAVAVMMMTAMGAYAQCTDCGWNANADKSRVWTANNGAFVGIGTGSAAATDSKLTIVGTEIFRYAVNPGARIVDFDFNHLVNAAQARNGAAMRIDNRWGPPENFNIPAFSWMIREAGAALPGSTETTKMVLDRNGNLGIGTVSPANKLEVVGNAFISGTVAGGNIQAKYQDVAEWVPAEEDIPAATVVVLDPERSNHVMASTTAYDQAVAGVISARPGITLGEESDSKVKVATTGRVKVKVDATKAPIKIGDLLVTSDVAGVAMKSIPVDVAGVKMHRPGTVIGKALEPLASGKGEILVLLSLQ